MTREELSKVAKPILFNTEMVQAILDGRKTCTRRIVKPQPIIKNDGNIDGVKPQVIYTSWKNFINHEAPYQAGDILYVRETWKIQSMSNSDKRIKFMYRANGNKDLETRYVADDRYKELLKYESKNGWQPSLFMPKTAARIFLKVTDVRVERLQDITKDYNNFNKEGIKEEHGFRSEMHRDFIELWKSTIKKQDLDQYGWEANPFVWVIEFERVEVE